MFHKRLLREFSDNRKYVIGMVAAQWVSLLANVLLVFVLAKLIEAIAWGNAQGRLWYLAGAFACVISDEGCCVCRRQQMVLSCVSQCKARAAVAGV